MKKYRNLKPDDLAPSLDSCLEVVIVLFEICPNGSG